MTFRPKQKNYKSVFISAFCAAFSVAAFYISSLVDRFMIIYQLFAIVTAVVAIQVFLKYIQCDYVYKLGDHELEIFKVTGNNSVCVCSLSYEESLKTAVTNKHYKENKKDFPTSKILINYCKNIFPDEYCLYFFNFNGKVSELKFEPDEIFVNAFNEKITAALSRRESEENEEN